MKKLLIFLALLTPTVAMAEMSATDKKICTMLITEIPRNYNVSKLKLDPDIGYPATANAPIAICGYSAVSQDLYGDTPVFVTVTFNKANNRYTTEIR